MNVSLENPTAVTMLAMALYLVIKDLIVPMVKAFIADRNKAGEVPVTHDDYKTEIGLINTELAVLDTKVVGVKEDVSEMKMDIKYLRKHSK